MAKKNKIKFLSIHDAVFKNMQDPKIFSLLVKMAITMKKDMSW